MNSKISITSPKNLFVSFRENTDAYIEGRVFYEPKVSAVSSWCCPSEGRRHPLGDHLQEPRRVIRGAAQRQCFRRIRVFHFRLCERSLQAFRPLAMDSHPDLSQPGIATAEHLGERKVRHHGCRRHERKAS